MKTCRVHSVCVTRIHPQKYAGQCLGVMKLNAFGDRKLVSPPKHPTQNNHKLAAALYCISCGAQSL